MLGSIGVAFTLFLLELLVRLDSTYMDFNLRTFSRVILKRVQMQMEEEEEVVFQLEQ